MQASRRNCLYASLVLPALLLLAVRTHAEKLMIASTPPGATLEIHGAVVGTAPFETTYPNGYSHKTHTVFGTRLEHSMSLHIYKDGYAPQRMALTNGPFDWIAVTGHHHGRYFLLRSERFDITLEPASKSGKGTTEPGARAGPIRARPATSAWQNGGPAAPESGTIAVESDPPLADIYVDWKFAGQMPSTIHLASGPHHIELKLHGRQNWERELEVTNGSEITLRPLPELSPLKPSDH